MEMRVCEPCGRGFMRRQSNDTGIPRQTSPRGFVVVDLPKEVLSSESEATEVVFATWIVVSIEIRESLYFKQHTLHHVQKATLLGRFPLNADFFAQYRACRFNRASCRSAFGRWSILASSGVLEETPKSRNGRQSSRNNARALAQSGLGSAEP